MKTMPTVLVVEDEPAIAELVAVNLRHNGFRPLWAMDADSAQREMDAAVPDLVLLDWMLPGESGLNLAKRWRADKRCAEVPIIMVTAKGDERDRVSGLDAGADDYITKPFSTKELLARVRAVLRRKTPVSAQEPLGLGALSLDPATHRVAFGSQALRLGPTEFKLLQYLMAHPERVHSRGQLLDKVWGDHVYIEERTVDVHVKRLRESLGEGAAMLETVRGAGYRLTAQPVAASGPALAAAPRLHSA